MDTISAKSHIYSWREPITPLHSGGTERTTLEAHQNEVDKMSASVRGFFDRKERFRIYHGSTNSTRKEALGRDPKKVVDTSRLNHVVHVDAEKETVLVEPNVPMDRLIEDTLKYNLIPPVVMEFPGITVGGGYNGTAGESSSFKHGFFDQSINYVEMVLGNGEVITASRKSNADLFQGAAGAVGTFGVTTMVELQLHKATKFVEATYHPVSSVQEAVDLISDFTARADEFDYIDGVMFSMTSGAIVTGRMTDSPSEGCGVQRFSDAKDPWFYLHVRDRISKYATPSSDAIPLPDYLFRYDRGGFWVGRETFNYFPVVPFNQYTRWLLDDFLHTRMLYNALHATGKSEHMIIQDLALPFEAAADFIEWQDHLVGIWPLWLCPLKQSPQPTMHPHLKVHDGGDEPLKPMLNVGLWGKAPSGHEAYVLANRAIEEKLQELGGMKWFYAQSYSPENEFWSDFDREWYDKLQEKYHATTLPDVYDKVKVDVEAEEVAKKDAGIGAKMLDMWPISGLYGLKKAIDSGDYLPRKPAWRDWVPPN